MFCTLYRKRDYGVSEQKFFKLACALPLAKARTIIDQAMKTGREHDLMPLTVAVLDIGGHLVSLDREDGSGIVRTQIAIGKAWGALGMGFSSRGIGERLQGKDSFLNALAAASEGRLFPVPGGVLVLNGEKEIIGAVGISGDNSDNDEMCAVAGIKAAGLEPMAK